VAPLGRSRGGSIGAITISGVAPLWRSQGGSIRPIINNEFLGSSNTKEVEVEGSAELDVTFPSDETQHNAAISYEQESEVTEELSSRSPDQNTEDGYNTYPNNVQIEEIIQGAETLLDGSLKQHSKTYDRAVAFLNLPKEDYSREALKEAISVVKDYSILTEIVSGGAIAISTYHNIQEGKILIKAKEIDKKVNGVGWEERADKMFPYSKSTRCSRMSIAGVQGVESYTIVGTERLRDAARVINKMGIAGPDQIKELYEFLGEVCDLNIGHVEFKRQFDIVLGMALTRDSENDTKISVENEKKGRNLISKSICHSDILTNPAEPITNGADHGDKGVESSCVDNIKTATPSENLQIQYLIEGGKKETDGSVDHGQQDKEGKAEDDDKLIKNSNEKFLNQDSLNKQLTKIGQSIDLLLHTTISDKQFDLILLEKVREKLEALERHITSISKAN
jgi:hypothetical protein